MYYKTHFIFIFAFLICCTERSKTTPVLAGTAAGSETVTNMVSLGEKTSTGLVALPFDFEKYTTLCIQKGASECAERYPLLNEESSRELMTQLSSKLEGTPERIFQLHSRLKDNLKIYIICFEGDSSSEEMVVMKENQIVSQESVGYAMPENKTYQSFSVNEDLSVDIYEVNYSDFKKKTIRKYKILADGSISKI
ncbi:hypothetical protein [Chryseobacterium sp. SIMBA_029]|uniref:hypothetical protein n=1 Tax=Chryseobacterium sp. SIMBA_029 TaxID=3085772 RepID=UPI00397AB7B8